MLNKIHITITSIAIGGCIILAILLQRSCNKNADADNFKNMYNASSDSLHKTINALGHEKTTTALLHGSVENLKAINSSKDKALAELQKIVDKKTISATVLGTSTSNTVTSTTTVISHDTVVKKDTVYIYPEYELKRDSSKWHDISAKATRDSFSVHYKVFNEYEIKQSWQKQKGLKKLFSSDVPVVSVLNLNPHTETRELKSFELKPKKHSWIKSFAEGVIAVELIRIAYNTFHK